MAKHSMVAKAWISLMIISILFAFFIIILSNVDMEPTLSVKGSFTGDGAETYLSFYCIGESQINLKINDKVRIMDTNGNRTLYGEVDHFAGTSYSVEEGIVNRCFIRITDGNVSPGFERSVTVKKIKDKKKPNLMNILSYTERDKEFVSTKCLQSLSIKYKLHHNILDNAKIFMRFI